MNRMLLRFLSWVRRVPIDDPVDLRNAVFMQWLLLFEGLRTPLNKIYLISLHWPYMVEHFYGKARLGVHAAIAIDMGTDLAMTLSAWTGIYLIRKGKFRAAVALFLEVMLGSAALAYIAFGYQVINDNLTMIMLLALSGMMLGRKALWIAYGAEVAILTVSSAPISIGHALMPPSALIDTYGHLPLQTLLSYLLIAIILDRSIHALRDSLVESNHQRQLLSREIAERERTHEQLLHAQKMDAIGKLASGIAHDINNVFGIILGFSTERDRLAGLTEKDAGLREEIHSIEDAMEGIELAARRGASVCRKLLNFSRRDVTQLETFDMALALRELQPLIRQILPPSIRFQAHIPNRETPIRFDRSQFELAIINLVSNARDAMPAGGICTLALELGQTHANLSVQDTGTGIPEHIKEKIFEPFFTTKPVGSGTGLGLSVVYGLIQRAGGEISVESAPDKGSIFRIGLPMTPSPDAAQPSGVTERRHHVLLVDDDQDLRVVLAKALKKKGYDVTEACDGANAEYLAQHMQYAPDVIVCDHHMPGADGTQVLRKLRDRFHEIPAILISAHLDTDGLPARSDEPNIKRLPKPFSPDALVASVAASLGQHGSGAMKALRD
ncbi:hybrid sensor histidine kinase/response regulator [Dyella agri]|uniref:histidine kinase n=1 Tax=Dyella agri TaxID=1926869 RepID=A0ABW8KEL6_9GAMM